MGLFIEGRGRIVAFLVLGAMLLLGPWPLSAAEPPVAQPTKTQPQPTNTQPQPTASDLDEAKRLFKEGNGLLDAGAYEEALGRFLSSRDKVASMANTKNAAICLDKLERYDEAYELYLELAGSFADKLRAGERTALQREVKRLKAKLGQVEVVANVTGVLVIDGRPRGKLPRAAVPVLPGRRAVHVIEQGYESFKTEVQVVAGATVKVNAELDALDAIGKLRIDEPSGAEVYVDGARVGLVPFNGVLSAGRHYYQLRKGDEGSAPQAVAIVNGQTALAEPKLEPLGPKLAVSVEPATAELMVGDVPVGKGRWEGRLPLGDWQLSGREEGYETAIRKLKVGPDAEAAVVLRLEPDRAHPRWEGAGRFWVEVFGGFAARSLASERRGAKLRGWRSAVSSGRLGARRHGRRACWLRVSHSAVSHARGRLPVGWQKHRAHYHRVQRHRWRLDSHDLPAAR